LTFHFSTKLKGTFCFYFLFLWKHLSYRTIDILNCWFYPKSFHQTIEKLESLEFRRPFSPHQTIYTCLITNRKDIFQTVEFFPQIFWHLPSAIALRQKLISSTNVSKCIHPPPIHNLTWQMSQKNNVISGWMRWSLVYHAIGYGDKKESHLLFQKYFWHQKSIYFQNDNHLSCKKITEMNLRIDLWVKHAIIWSNILIILFPNQSFWDYIFQPTKNSSIV